MKKECPICGESFETNRSTKKYCDSCKDPHAYRKEFYMNKNLVESKNRYKKPTLIEGECHICGKYIKIEKRYANQMNNYKYLFCSNKCRLKYIDSLKYCNWCGKLLEDSYIKDGDIFYCSEECKQDKNEYFTKIESAPKIVSGICPTCGKLINKKNKTYCDKNCYLNYIAN